MNAHENTMTNPQTPHILVHLPGPLGDAVLATPALHALRSDLPHAHIAFLASPAVRETLDGADLNDQWLPTSPRTADLRPFQVAILLPNSFRAALHAARARITIRIGYRRDARGPLLTHPLDPIRLPAPRAASTFPPISMLDYYHRLIQHALVVLSRSSQHHPNLSPLGEMSAIRGQRGYLRPGAPPEAAHHLHLATSDADRNAVDRLLRNWRVSSPDRLVILVPGGAFGPSKLWPARNFAQLADALIERHCCHVLLSCAPNPAETTLAAAIRRHAHYPLLSLTDQPVPLGRLKELIRRARLVIANDTGPCHLAAAFNTPLVTLFGPTDPRWTATGYPREIRLRLDVRCGPCQQKSCSVPGHPCLDAISPDQVLHAAESLLQSPPPPDAPPHWPGRPGHFYRPFDESFTPLEPTGLIHRAYADRLAAAGLHDIPAFLDHDAGQLLHKPGLGHRQRIRLQLPPSDPADAPLTVYLKRFTEPAGPIRLRHPSRHLFGSGLREFANALALAAAHVPVPRPLATGQLRQGPALRSFFLSEELPDADALERLLPRLSETRQHYALLRDPRRLIAELADLVARLHGAGFFHRDLYLSHVFLARDSQGRESLHLIDLARVFRPLRPRRWRIKDLAQLHYSAHPFFSRTDALRFLRHYLCRTTTRLTPPEKRLARAILKKSARIAHHETHRQKRLQNHP